MSDARPRPADIGRSYHPHGYDESASLRRARKPYITRNFLTGAAIVSFIVGVYAYSISAVKQDDFSDVVDLLPPESERHLIRTLEDEAREKELLAAPIVAIPAPAAEAPRASVLSYLTPKRLSEVEWVKGSGLVEEGKGNLLVWGAPNVDKIGSMREAGDSRGRRLV